jgi:hypothetical protein
VIQSFGRENEYKRAILTVLSFYAHCSLPKEQTRVLFFTDQPEYFSNYLQGLPVEYVLLTPEKIKQMRGEIDFLHRMKIAVIEEAFNKAEGNILYADSDTFFINDPAFMLDQLTPAKSFMHLLEYPFESLRDFPLPTGKTARAFVHLIENKVFYGADGREIKLSTQDISWNAGVMMFHSSHARFIPDVYALTDQFYPETSNHASEQFAFSIMLQKNTTINACDNVIYHYWYRTKKNIVDLLLEQKFNSQWAALLLQKKIEDVKNWSIKLPSVFKNHILTVQDNAIQAFNENKFREAYLWSIKAFLKKPFLDKSFLKDVAYHTKRLLKKN